MTEQPKKIVKGAGGLGGSSSGNGTIRDNLISDDVVEFTLGLCEGPIGGLARGPRSFYLDDTPLVGPGGENNFDPFHLELFHGDADPTVVRNTLGGVSSNVQVGVQMSQNVPVIRTTPSNLRNQIDQIEIRLVFHHVAGYGSKGNQVNYKAQFEIQYRQSGEVTWNDLFPDTPTIEIYGKTTSNYPKEYVLNVPRINNDWEIRVNKLQEDSHPNYVIDFSWESFQCTTQEDRSYPNLAVIRGIGKASDRFSSIPEFSGVYALQLINVPSNYDPITRYYDGVWDGTFKLAHSDNPAWAVYDMIMNPDTGLKAYDPTINADRFSFYDAAKWCDELVPIPGTTNFQPRWTYNDLITSQRQGIDLIYYVSGLFGGVPDSDRNGNVVMRVDKPSNIVQVFGPESVENGIFSYQRTDVTERKNDITVKFINPNLGWNEDARRVFDQDLIDANGRLNETMTAIGCIDTHESQRRAFRRLLQANTEQLTVSFTTTRAGISLELFQLIGISDPDMNWGLSGRVKSQSGSTIYLRDALFVPVATDMTLLVQTPTGPQQLTVQSSVANTKELTITAGTWPANAPAVAQFTLSSAEIGLVKPFRILEIKPGGDDDRITITALEHNVNKYGDVDNLVSTPTVDYGFTGSDYPAAPVIDVVESGDPHILTNADGSQVNRLLVRWAKDPKTMSKTFEVAYRVKDEEDYQFISALGTEIYIPYLIPGKTYEVKVRGVSPVGRKGPYSSISEHVMTGRVTPPDDVPAITATLNGRNVELSFASLADPEVAEYLVREGADWDTGTPIGSTTENHFVDANIPSPDRDYYVKALTKSGLLSAVASSVSVSVDAPETPVGFNLNSEVRSVNLIGPISTNPYFQHYKVYAAASGVLFAGATPVGTFSTNQFSYVPVSNQVNFWITEVDIWGRESAPSVVLTGTPTAVETADLGTSVTDAIDAAAQSATADVLAAEAARDAAIVAQGAAEGAATNSATAQGLAEAARDAAGVFSSNALSAQGLAEDAQEQAENAAASASSSAGVAVGALDVVTDYIPALHPIIPRTPAESWTGFSSTVTATLRKTALNATWLVDNDAEYGYAARPTLGGNLTVGHADPLPWDQDRVYEVEVHYRVIDNGAAGLGVRKFIGASVYNLDLSTDINNQQTNEQTHLVADGLQVDKVWFSYRDLTGIGSPDARMQINSTTGAYVYFHIRQNAGGTTNGQISLGKFIVRDITSAVDALIESGNAATSAAAAAVSEFNAGVSETAAASEAAAAQSERVLAETARSGAESAETAAATSATTATNAASAASASETVATNAATAAGNSATAAANSASTASSEASDAAGSAASAASSESVTAQIAAEQFPHDFEREELFWVPQSNLAADNPNTIAGIATFPTVDGRKVAEVTGEAARVVRVRALAPAVAGHTYRVTIQARQTTGALRSVRAWLRTLSSTYTSVQDAFTTFTFTSLNAWETFSATITLSEPLGAEVWVGAFWYNWANTASDVFQIRDILFEDVTESTNAAASAAAAVISASTAAASETAAGQHAAAAQTAETNAQTSQAGAEAAETQAATSATNAAGSEAAAASSAAAAANSATQAGASATAAADSASTASTQATNAAQSATAAQSAQTAAETAEAGALASEIASASSETNAGASAIDAAASAEFARSLELSTKYRLMAAGAVSEQVCVTNTTRNYVFAVATDGTSIFKNGAPMATLNRGDLHTESCVFGDSFTADGPFTASSESIQLASVAHAGKRFVSYRSRASNTSGITVNILPLADGQVRYAFRNYPGTGVHNFDVDGLSWETVTERTLKTMALTTTTDDGDFTLESTVPCLVYIGQAVGIDENLLWPVSERLLTDRASSLVIRVDTTKNLVQNGVYYHVEDYDGYVACFATGDGAGGDSEQFPPYDALGDEYILPQASIADYRILTDEKITVYVRDKNGTVIGQHDIDGSVTPTSLDVGSQAGNGTAISTNGPFYFSGTGKFGLRSNNNEDEFSAIGWLRALEGMAGVGAISAGVYHASYAETQADAAYASAQAAETSRINAEGAQGAAEAASTLAVGYRDDAAGSAASALSSATLAAQITANATGFAEHWTADGAENLWEKHTGGATPTIVEVADAPTGGKALRVGDNSGDDEWWASHEKLIPFDPSRRYRTTVVLRRLAGTGTAYIGFTGVRSDGVTLCNITGAATHTSQHYHVASALNPSSSWQTIVGYTEGFGSPNGSAAGLVHEDVRFLRPLIVVNYNDQPGIVEIASFVVEDVTDTDSLAGRISEIETLDLSAGTALATFLNEMQVDANGNSAAVATFNQTSADVTGFASAFSGVTVSTNGGNVAGFYLNSWADPDGSGGSMMKLLGDVIVPGTLTVNAFEAGLGENLVENDDFLDDFSGWGSWGSGDVGVDTTFTIRAAGLTWSHPHHPVGQMFQSTGDTTGYEQVEYRGFDEDGALLPGIPVVPGQKYGAAMRVSTHRCNADFKILWYDASNVWLAASAADAMGEIPGASTDLPSTWHRLEVVQTAPTGAAYARLALRKYGTYSGQANSYCFFAEPVFSEVHAEATKPPAYTKGGKTLINGNRIVTDTILAESINTSSFAAAGLAIFGGGFQSDDYVTGVSGFKMDKDGTLEVYDLIERSALKQGAASIRAYDHKTNTVAVSWNADVDLSDPIAATFAPYEGSGSGGGVPHDNPVTISASISISVTNNASASLRVMLFGRVGAGAWSEISTGYRTKTSWFPNANGFQTQMTSFIIDALASGGLPDFDEFKFVGRIDAGTTGACNVTTRSFKLEQLNR